MTKQTAQNIIHFIETKPDIEKVQFTWFGGEPMMNAELIEYICNWFFNFSNDYKWLFIG